MEGNNMLVVHYKPDNVSQEWGILDYFDNKASALANAYVASAIYFMVKVTDIDGSVIWSD
jgi:hypothetical protein